MQHLQEDGKVGMVKRVKRNGEQNKRRNQRSRRRKSYQRSFWASLGRLNSDDEVESDMIVTIEPRRRSDAVDEKLNIQHVVRGRDDMGTVDVIEQSRSSGVSDSKYQDQADLVKLLNSLRKENKVIYNHVRELAFFS